MPTYFVQTSLTVQSGLPEDEIVNTYTFDGAGTGTEAGDVTAITGHLADFYDELINEDILGEWFTGTIVMAVYTPNIGTGVVGAPVDVVQHIGPVPSTSTLPLEVSLCLSFASNDPEATPAARRRGRVFLGPMSSMVGTAGPPPRPQAAALTIVRDAYAVLATGTGNDNLGQQVWSRTDAALYGVDRMWIDNEWDTMRSRQVKATSRAVFPPP